MNDRAAPGAPEQQALRCAPLPFFEEPVAALRRLRPLPAPVLLDSAGASPHARWDILAADPEVGAGLYLPPQLTGAALRDALAAFNARVRDGLAGGERDAPEIAALPFSGGYIGHLSYELGRRLQGLAPQAVTTPLAVVHRYPWAIVQDRRGARSWLVGRWSESQQRTIARLLTQEEAPGEAPFQLTSAFRATWQREDFAAAFARAQDYIRAGDCYQVNIGQAFRASFRGDLLEAYATLRQAAQAPFSAFFPLDGDSTLLSVSPERFLRVDGTGVETRPIKGTRPRSADAATDRAAAEELLASPKERAENLMIVDLLRNDLGRFCRTGSVRVEELFALESYATVHHLVSSVRGQLRDDVSPFELLLGCLPGGSITGAPKHRAMQVIDELEVAPRGPWCGSVFYLSRTGRLDSNLTIRSPYARGETLICWAGGGLVADSEAAAEYAEQGHKIGALIGALERAHGSGDFSTPAASGR